MSQALQSLNNILKYRLERDRQKIGESLSMLEMGTKLKQQAYENNLQDKMMDFRIAQEKRAEAKDDRDKKLANINLKAARLELQKIERQESPEMIELARKAKELTIKKTETELKVDEEALEEYKQKRLDEAVEKASASIDTMYQNKAKNIIEDLKNNNIIPASVWQEVQVALSDGYDVNTDLDSVRTNVLKRLGKNEFWPDEKAMKPQREYLKELLRSDKYGNLILSGIAQTVLTEAAGQPNYEPLMKTFDELSVNMMHDKDLKVKMENAGIPHQHLAMGFYNIGQVQDNKEAIEQAKLSGRFQSSLDRLMQEQDRKQTNEKIEELGRVFAEQSGLHYITEEEKQILIDQGIPPEELE